MKIANLFPSHRVLRAAATRRGQEQQDMLRMTLGLRRSVTNDRLDPILPPLPLSHFTPVPLYQIPDEGYK